MTRSVADYVALALISRVRLDDENDVFSGVYSSRSDFAGDLVALKEHAERRCGFLLTDQIVAQAMRTLAQCGLIRVTDDHYSGTFVKIKASEFPAFVEKADKEFAAAREQDDEVGILTRPSDYPNASAMMGHELLEDYHELGDAWLKKALEGLRKRIDETGGYPADGEPGEDGRQTEVPASDRIVRLNDNAQLELESASNAVISAVEEANGIDGDPTVRDIILGQLRAGRELIRAQIFNAQIMHLLLMDALRRLVDKYDGHVIGATAATLIELLIKHVFGSN